MEGAHIIDIDDLVISMEGTKSANSVKFPLIQKMRRMPHDEDNDVYQPSVISIGPYHHKAHEATVEMAQIKWESFSFVLSLNPEKKMRDYLEAMAELEQRIKSCYASEIEIDNEQLLKIMVLDGCFLLYIFYGTNGAARPISSIDSLSTEERSLSLEQDVYYPKHWFATFLTHDLVLLENQIPFFVVVKLFEVVTDGNVPITVLLESIAEFMKNLLLSYPKANLKFDEPKELHHLLHLCHLYFKPLSTSYSETQSVIGGQQLLGWRRATEYYKAGVEFRKWEICSRSPHTLLDISFCNGVLEVPCLTIDPNTYYLLRNLTAFEETCPQFGNYMTTYVVFLSQLITMPEDVSLLTRRGIIVDQLDNGANINDLFGMLAEGVTFDFNGNYYFTHICHEMEVQYQMQRLRWRDWLGSIGSGYLTGLMKVSLISFLEDNLQSMMPTKKRNV